MDNSLLSTPLELGYLKSDLNSDEIKNLLSKIHQQSDKIINLAKFSETSYFRERIFINDYIEVLVLGWLNGQRSRIHDHAESACGVLVLQGEAVETTFKETASGHIYAISSTIHSEGDITFSNGNDIHQVSNLAIDGSSLITLHVYSPPIHRFHCYTLDSPIHELIETSQNWFYEI